MSAKVTVLEALTALTGNDTFEIVASTDFDGAVTEVMLYQETAACAPQGAYSYRFAALNAEGFASDVSSATTITII